MSHYLDTSVIVPLFIEEAADASQRWIGESEDELFVADLVVTEFHAVVSRPVRMGIMSEDRAATVRTLFDEWRGEAVESLENLPADIRVAGFLVRTPRPRLLTADATHLATCQRLDLTLVTYDADLQSVAEREGVRWSCPA